MVTITLKNAKHNTTARLRVEPVGETEVSRATLSGLRRKLCPNKFECDCGKDLLGAAGEGNPVVEYRSGRYIILMNQPVAPVKSAAAEVPYKREKAKKIVAGEEVNAINFSELESIINIGASHFLKEPLTEQEQHKLFTIIRGIRDEQNGKDVVEDVVVEDEPVEEKAE
jgi:hypothetical protein